MEFKEILSVTGKPCLCKIIAHTKTGLIVESLVDKKRFPVYSSDKISNLEDISIFSVEEDVPLKNVLKKISDKENGGKSIDHKSDDKTLRQYFLEVMPDFDQERVYNSDIKKVILWYNLLQENQLLDFDAWNKTDEETAKEIPEEVQQEKEEAAAEPKPKVKKTAKPVNKAPEKKKVKESDDKE